jgi:TnpA family transposase
VVISILLGKFSASTIIRRLGSEGIRSSLFYAFRELGRIVRTQFVLENIQDIEMRETVHAATCKSEEFNNFLQWVFFYNNGIIQENLQHEQAKLVKYNHLVANLIILHNVNAMSKVVKRLKHEGAGITEDLLAGCPLIEAAISICWGLTNYRRINGQNHSSLNFRDVLLKAKKAYFKSIISGT